MKLWHLLVVELLLVAAILWLGWRQGCWGWC